MPDGNGEAVEIVKISPGGRTTSMVNALSVVNGGVLLSATRMVKLDVPTLVSVPLMVGPERFRPEGNVPDRRENVYGPVPPEAANV